MRQHKDDIVKLLVGRGWIKGSGGECYFPENRRPHLHVRIKSGFNDYDVLTKWFSFLVVSRGNEGPNTYLVRNGNASPATLATMGRGEMKTEISELFKLKA